MVLVIELLGCLRCRLRRSRTVVQTVTIALLAARRYREWSTLSRQGGDVPRQAHP